MMLAFTLGCKQKKALPEQVVVPEAVEEMAEEAMGTEVPQELGPDSVYFMIERTACYGTCPVYRLTIYQDGTATYEGRRFAKREGLYSGKVDAALMKALTDAAEEKGIYGMDDVYDKPVTDLPSVIIRVHPDHRDKRVVGRVGAPQAFRDLAQEVEALLADVEWTKVGELH